MGETIVDEDSGSIAVFSELGVELATEQRVRKALRMHVADGKCTGYHEVWDSYNFLKSDEMMAAQPQSRGFDVLTAVAMFGFGILCTMFVSKQKEKKTALLSDGY